MSESVTVHFDTASPLSIDEAERLTEAVLYAVADYSAAGGLSGLCVRKVLAEYGRSGLFKQSVTFDAGGRPVARDEAGR